MKIIIIKINKNENIDTKKKYNINWFYFGIF